jgi:hypothetical protein
MKVRCAPPWLMMLAMSWSLVYTEMPTPRLVFSPGLTIQIFFRSFVRLAFSNLALVSFKIA